MEFYAYLGQIQGNGTIVGTGSKNYSVNYTAGVNYTWSLVEGYNNAYISTASQNNVTIQPTHSGFITLKLSVYSTGCQQISSQTKSIYINTNVCLEGTYDNNQINGINLNTANSVNAGSVNVHVSCPNASTYLWERTSSTILYWPNNNNVYFNLPPSSSISFKVTAKNSSGQVIAFRNISFYNFGSYLIYPNPSASSFKIDLNPDFEYTIRISPRSIDRSLSTTELKNYNVKDDFSISHLSEGTYDVKIYLKDSLLAVQQLLIKR